MDVFKQYSLESEARRARLARNLNALYGFTPAELIKLTGMKIRSPYVERELAKKEHVY